MNICSAAKQSINRFYQSIDILWSSDHLIAATAFSDTSSPAANRETASPRGPHLALEVDKLNSDLIYMFNVSLYTYRKPSSALSDNHKRMRCTAIHSPISWNKLSHRQPHHGRSGADAVSHPSGWSVVKCVRTERKRVIAVKNVHDQPERRDYLRRAIFSPGQVLPLDKCYRPSNWWQ